MGRPGLSPFSGEVISFMLAVKDQPLVYVTGDTGWFDGSRGSATLSGPRGASAGAAQTRGPFHLTMNTNDAIETAHAFPGAAIGPLHRGGGHAGPTRS
jgi:hypothetical protein